MTPYTQWETAAKTRDSAALLIQQGRLSYDWFARDSGLAAEQITGAFSHELNLDAFERAWLQVMAWYRIDRNGFRWIALPLHQRRINKPANPTPASWRDRGGPSRKPTPPMSVTFFSPPPAEEDDALAPSMTMTVTATGDHTYRFAWNIQRLLLDSYSVAILLKNLVYCYDLCARNLESELPNSAPDPDAIDRNRRCTFAEVRGFWRRTLRNLPSAQMPLSPGKSHRGSQRKTKPQSAAATSIDLPPSRWEFKAEQIGPPSLTTKAESVEFITHEGGRLRLPLDLAPGKSQSQTD
jgi:hypothetical protein